MKNARAALSRSIPKRYNIPTITAPENDPSVAEALLTPHFVHHDSAMDMDQRN